MIRKNTVDKFWNQAHSCRHDHEAIHRPLVFLVVPLKGGQTDHIVTKAAVRRLFDENSVLTANLSKKSQGRNQCQLSHPHRIY